MNPRPQSRERWRLRACPVLWISPSARCHRQGCERASLIKSPPGRLRPAFREHWPAVDSALIPAQAPRAKTRWLVSARQRARSRETSHLCFCWGFTRPPAPRLATIPTNRPRRSLSSPGLYVSSQCRASARTAEAPPGGSACRPAVQGRNCRDRAAKGPHRPPRVDHDRSRAPHSGQDAALSVPAVVVGVDDLDGRRAGTGNTGHDDHRVVWGGKAHVHSVSPSSEPEVKRT